MKKTLEEILVTYQKKKEKKEKENELIKKELYRKYPEFDEIERKIAKLYLQKSIKNLTIKKQNIDKGEFIKIDEISNIDKEIKKLEEKKEKYIKDKKIKISDFEPKYDCKKCKDTGYIIENGLRKKCDCLVQEIININYNISNLKSDEENILEKFSFDYYSEEKKENEKNSPRELAKKAYDGAKEFIKNFGKTKNNIKNIIYIGETGLR
jgi:DNA replication protein dnaC|nr:MAG TPA: DNA replication protein DnaC [Caudoviricetes sp.]